VALLAAGIVVLVSPARPVRRDDRYVTPAARRESAATGPDSEDDAGRDLWQELDDGRDPTG
ncbi:TIGR02234 family membrane protein, partial [Dietzia sp. SLG510A3-30A2]|nr:TIGR02234 family membrane protein [Dietzia sp. SLG510A3-30A2]